MPETFPNPDELFKTPEQIKKGIRGVGIQMTAFGDGRIPKEFGNFYGFGMFFGALAGAVIDYIENESEKNAKLDLTVDEIEILKNMAKFVKNEVVPVMKKDLEVNVPEKDQQQHFREFTEFWNDASTQLDIIVSSL